MLENFLNGDNTLRPEETQALYVDFRNRHPNLKPKTEEFKEAIIQDDYFNCLLMKYGYAVTCHKAQGGEWQNVFFFLNKSMYGLPQKQMLQLWYTGITRSKKRLHLHNDWWIK